MDHVRLFESVPNFSDGRRQAVIEAVTAAAQPAFVLDVHPDPDHNRTVVTLAGESSHLLAGIVASSAAAIERIDIRDHRGVHPRVGAADVVPIVPLGKTTLDDCVEISRELGERIWQELHVPVYFYGRGTTVRLADIRAGRAAPDLGGPSHHRSAGAVCVGARAPLVAFNVLLPGRDRASALEVARAVRESNRGMRGVQALVFELPGGRMQLSMNLFRLDETRPSDVLSRLAGLGVEAGDEELVGLCPAQFGGPFAARRLLEARLASAAAGAGAEALLATNDEESRAVGQSLRREAQTMSALHADLESILAGAERAVALRAVMRAAGALDPERESTLMVAASGFRRALPAAFESAQPARVGALDRALAAY